MLHLALVTLFLTPTATAGFADCDAVDAPATHNTYKCDDMPGGVNNCYLLGSTLYCDYSASGLEVDAVIVTRYQAGPDDFSIFGDAGGAKFCCTYEDTNAVVTAVELTGTALGDDLRFQHIGEATHDRLKPHLGQTVQLTGRMYGGDGADYLLGSDFNAGYLYYKEKLYGQADPDIIAGDDGPDYIHGGLGADYIQADDPGSTDDADDFVFGDYGDDEIYGYDGRDTIAGGPGADTIYGGNDSDKLDGRGNVDTIYGEGGNDLVMGESETYDDAGDADQLYGGIGNDVICAQPNLTNGDGGDLLVGGSGTDTMFYGSRWYLAGSDPVDATSDAGIELNEECGDDLGLPIGFFGCDIQIYAQPTWCSDTPTNDCDDLECLY